MQNKLFSSAGDTPRTGSGLQFDHGGVGKVRLGNFDQVKLFLGQRGAMAAVSQVVMFGNKSLVAEVGLGGGRVEIIFMSCADAGLDELDIELAAPRGIGMEHGQYRRCVNRKAVAGVDISMVAGPAPLRGAANEVGSDWIEMDIAQELQQVGVFLAEDRFEAVLKDMAEAFAGDVEIFGVVEHEPMHDDRDGELIDFDKQMEVIGHEAVGVESERLAAFNFGEGFEE